MSRLRIGVLRAVGAAALALLLAPTVSARDLRPGIIGVDDRVPVDALEPPWAAVGQVNAARYRHRASCTGTLIAPDRVITAAHCVTDPSTGRVLPQAAIHFLTGVFGSRWKEHAQPRCVILPETRLQRAKAPPRRPPAGRPLAWFVDDYAVLVLEKPLQAPPLPVDAADVADAPPSGRLLSHAAYAGDRRQRLTAHLGCERRAGSRDGLWLTDCDTHHAGSGGPVLINRGDGYRLAGVLVGTAEKRFTIAVPAAIWRSFAARAACPGTTSGSE